MLAWILRSAPPEQNLGANHNCTVTVSKTRVEHTAEGLSSFGEDMDDCLTKALLQTIAI